MASKKAQIRMFVEECETHSSRMHNASIEGHRLAAMALLRREPEAALSSRVFAGDIEEVSRLLEKSARLLRDYADTL